MYPSLLLQLRDLSRVQGDYTNADLIEDIVHMLELFINLDTTRSVLGDLGALEELGDLVRDVANFVVNITESGAVNDIAL